ncbi:GroES-like protein [Violaceomyces palustris]|uniref:GroES-like protein n=1 Tax=Violaceomyces palustris TaxID=1673888 RepID=A0ACD0NNJ7_9BASI|nr:GroES-like protein [Violaceomyces palustris]
MSSRDIPSKMKAATIKDFKKGYEVKEIEVPTNLEPFEVLVQIKAAGYCHTDLQVMEGVYEKDGSKPGLVGSHEPAGIVVKAGSETKEYGISVGDRVGSINTFGYCGSCDSCKVGEQLCERMKGMLGLTLDGGFAQYMKADARVVSKIPENIGFAEAAPLFCAGATIFGALKALEPKEGEWLALVGVGGLGHLGIQYAKSMGCKVIAIDNREEGIQLANDVPSHLVPDRSFVVASEESKNKCVEEINKLTYGTNPGVDKVVIATEDRFLIKFSQRFLRKGGSLVDVGLPADGPFEVDPFALNFKEQTIRGRLICTPQECQEMIRLHSEKGCRTHIEATYPVEEANQLAQHYLSKKLKGRLCMTFN